MKKTDLLVLFVNEQHPLRALKDELRGFAFSECLISMPKASNIAKRYRNIASDSVAANFWDNAPGDPVLHVGRAGEAISFLASRDLLEACGVYRAGRTPLWDEYVEIEGYPSRATVILTGSHSYGLSDERSDFDVSVVSEDRWSPCVDHLRAYVRHFTPADLMQAVMEGNRHAWEIISARQDQLLRKHEMIDRTIDAVRKRSHLVPAKAFLASSESYWRRWYPNMLVGIKDQPDEMLRSWMREKGWPYKMGYYLFVDSYLSWRVMTKGPPYDPIHVQEVKDAAIKIKRGQATLEEWKHMIERYVPPNARFR